MPFDRDKTFKIFVKGEKDFQGMIAYAIYRLRKAEHFANQSPTSEDFDAFRSDCTTGDAYIDIQDTAAETIERFTSRIIRNYGLNKFWHNIRVGILASLFAGLISGVLANPAWKAILLAVNSDYVSSVSHLKVVKTQ